MRATAPVRALAPALHPVAFTLLASALLTGCSVLEIAVDVYKGPLANEYDVKTEQYASMAIGAKPILVQLRDKLQWPDDEKRKQMRSDSCYRADFMAAVDNDPAKGVYEKGEIMPFPEDCWTDEKALITSERAIPVNNVLWLYKDIERPTDRKEATIKSEEAKAGGDPKLNEKFNSSFKILVNPDASANAPLPELRPADLPEKIRILRKWQFERLLLGTAFAQDPELFQDLVSLADDPDKTPTRGLLIKAYSYLFSESDPTPLGLLLKWTAQTSSTDTRPARNIPGNHNTDLSWNALFQMLENRRLVKAHADLVFDTDQSQANRFTNQVTTIAEAFRSSRETLSYLWQNSLEKLADLPIAQAADIDPLISLITKGTQPVFMSAAYCHLSKQHAVDLFHSKLELLNFIEASFKGTLLLETDKLSKGLGRPTWSKEDYETANTQIKERLADPKTRNKAIDALLGLNAYVREFDGQFSSGCRTYYDEFDILSTRAGRRYGIVRDPIGVPLDIAEGENTDNIETNVPENIKTVVKEASEALARQSSTGGGLARGRLDQGLETLIENFLNASVQPAYLQASRKNKNCDAPACTGVNNSREILNGALLRFSEKLLFMANHDILLPARTSQPASESSESSETSENLALVLQAIGNAIQVLGDELAMRQGFDKRSQDLADTETAAIDFSRDWPKASTCLTDTGIQQQNLAPLEQNGGTGASQAAASGTCLTIAGSSDSRPSQIQVFDRVVASLRQRLIKRTAEQAPKAELDQLTHALSLAYEQRAGMAYIRPASIYLRSSYAATGLQSGNDVLWHNKLTEHGAASIPLFGPLFANDKTARKQAIVVSQIDKQFWQTINKVSVKGAGSTNYAIVKDDIGNWYVKGYSTDTSSITKSAIALATAQLGAGLSAAELDAGTVSSPATISDPNMSRKIQKDRDADTSNRKRLLDSLLADTDPAGYISGLIQAGWASIIDANLKKAYLDSDVKGGLKQALDGSLKTIRDAIAGEATQKDTDAAFTGGLSQLAQIEAVLYARLVTLGFDSLLDERVKQADAAVEKADAAIATAAKTAAPEDDAAAKDAQEKASSEQAAIIALKEILPTARKEAAKIAGDLIKEDIARRITSRLEALNGYHTTLTVFHETLKP